MPKEDLTCENCEAYHARNGMRGNCRLKPPAYTGFPAVRCTDWCLELVPVPTNEMADDDPRSS